MLCFRGTASHVLSIKSYKLLIPFTKHSRVLTVENQGFKNTLEKGEDAVNPIPNKPLFLHVCSTSTFENTEGKGEIALNEQFLLSHSVFYPFVEHSAIFIKFEIVEC